MEAQPQRNRRKSCSVGSGGLWWKTAAAPRRRAARGENLSSVFTHVGKLDECCHTTPPLLVISGGRRFVAKPFALAKPAVGRPRAFIHGATPLGSSPREAIVAGHKFLPPSMSSRARPGIHPEISPQPQGVSSAWANPNTSGWTPAQGRGDTEFSLAMLPHPPRSSPLGSTQGHFT